MSRFTRWFWRCIDKLRGIWYEGPKPPNRLAVAIDYYFIINPNASRAELKRFMIDFSNECYRTGWERGFYWVERELDKLPEHHPDKIADMISNDWRESNNVLQHNTEHDTRQPIDERDIERRSIEYFRDRTGIGPSR